MPDDGQRRTSLDTNASGLNSVMSFAGFSGRFPAVPTSVPASPMSSFFPRTPASNAGSTSRLRDGQISSSDWHEGASTIDNMDAASLLSTSFITNLLRDADPAAGYPNHRASLRSDFTEMTYPPPRTQVSPSPRAVPSQRPNGGRPPPSSFNPIPEAGMVSDDDDTLYTRLDDVGGRAMQRSQSANTDGDSSRTNLKVTSGAPSYGMKEGMDLEYTPHESFPFSPALPSTAGTRQRFLPDTAPEVRQSMHSNRSRRSVVPSFISATRSIRQAFTWRKKPLPPIPKIPQFTSLAQEAEYKQKDDTAPLSQLLLRSDALRTALDSGQHPHSSFVSKSPMLLSEDEQSPAFRRATPSGVPSAYWNQSQANPPPSEPLRRVALAKKRRLWIIMIVFGIVALAAIGAGIGVTVHNKDDKATTSTCSGNLAGAACDLDATCVCTSPVANRCDGLAQNLVTLTPTMNKLLGTNYTTHDVYLWIWTVQGTITTSTCASQAVLVDVGAVSSLTNFPNRTLWAQSALLWDLQSLNNTALRHFILDAPWDLLTVDGPVHESNASLFSTTASGYNFDFAAQTLSVPSVSFASDGAPTSAQAAEVSNTAPLDPSSTQYAGLLQAYWVTNLQRTSSTLSTFMKLLASAPIMVPFNVETSSVRALMTSSSTFPVPIACYPNLTTTQVQQINTIETVFGLDPINSTASTFQSSCFPGRPTYGILDAVALHSDVGSRAVVYSGEVLSALPGTSNASVVPSTDPATYGTLNHLNHVVLDYLSGMPILTANAVVEFVLSNSTTPPDSSSLLYTTTVPLLEVAVFGTIAKTDYDFVSSGFADSSGALVFGTSDGSALRDWQEGILIWTEFSNSSEIVHDTESSSVFNQTWEAAADALASGSKVGVLNVTNALATQNGLFTPS
ncbi:hypothetical protein HMN09_00642100 [Mycena chlorophos]|uniref:Uncharacterized protein n=1 Tax=Mycena chlorophos TaxID=658473 RepID=A0A8H6T4P8_MYCCL|nr:hypothetical protein HMN09_00642100 [Mycena chlorophos]